MPLDKKVFIHDSLIDPIGQRGVDRCFMNYSLALIEEFQDNAIIYSKRTFASSRAKLFYPLSHYLSDPFPRRISSLMDEKYGELIADKFANVYYSPYYGKIRTKIPQIFTVHDMIYEKYPQYFVQKNDKSFIKEKKACFDRAALIFCVSHNTANDVKDLYPDVSENKIRVVYNGVNESFFDADCQKYDGKPYFLYVGNRSLYKNFWRLLTAFGKSNLKKIFDLRIISPANDFPTNQELEIIKKYNLKESVHVEISITDKELINRYQQAYAFIFPSEYEGFGLPLLEAMASGTLVLASNSSSLPEIGKEIPLYFDPLSIESIIETLKNASLLNEDERQDRIINGKKHAATFTWTEAKKNFIREINSIL